MMKVSVVKFGEAVRQVEIPEGTSLRELLTQLGEPGPRDGFDVSVGGTNVAEQELDRPLQPEDQVLLTPRVVGGRS